MVLSFFCSTFATELEKEYFFISMKTKIALFLGAMLLLTACADSAAVREVKGAYHYKTTGKVILVDKSAGKADNVTVNLDNECRICGPVDTYRRIFHTRLRTLLY